MSTVSVPSIEAFLAAVEAAEQRLVSGEAKARHAKALLLQAEKARDEAAARKAEAQQQLAPIEEALNKARALRALVGEVVISQGEALLEQTWAEAQAEVTRLQTEAEAAQAEVERLMAAPEVQAYLDYREAQERAHREVRERERRELEVRLAALRPGAAVGQGTGPLAELAAQARKTGFPNLAAQAQDAAEAARQVAKAQAQAEKALRKRRLIRWAERRSTQAQPGDFVFVVSEVGGKDEEASDGPGAALHLRPLPARSGRLRFQVIAACGIENPPGEYGDVPARGRAWRWRNPPNGEPEGLTEAQAGMVAQIARGRLRSGWSINRANARLARQTARDKDKERKATRESRSARDVQSAVPVDQPPQSQEHRPAEPQPQPVKTEPDVDAKATGDLEGLPPQVAARLRRVGLNSRKAVEDTLTAGQDVLLSMPGIGPATLDAVQAWLNACVQADADSEVRETEGETKFDSQSLTESEGLQREMVGDESQDEPAAQSQPPAGDQSSGEADQVEPGAETQSPIAELDVNISVEGDGVSGQRLARWQGVANVGLTPVAKRLGLEEIQVLVHEEQGQSTLIAYWPGGETTISCPIDGRAAQMRAVRKLVQQIRAAA
jgi:hypothetical protein